MADKQPEWQKYKKMMVNKRTEKKEEKKNLGKTNGIMVQKMNHAVTGKLKKCESLEAKEFVELTNFSSITLKIVKQACEDHYNQQIGSCDVPTSDRGPSCVKNGQIATKYFLMQFLESNNHTRVGIFIL